MVLLVCPDPFELKFHRNIFFSYNCNHLVTSWDLSWDPKAGKHWSLISLKFIINLIKVFIKYVLLFKYVFGGEEIRVLMHVRDRTDITDGREAWIPFVKCQLGQQSERQIIRRGCLRSVGNIKEERQKTLMCVLHRRRERWGCGSFCFSNTWTYF